MIAIIKHWLYKIKLCVFSDITKSIDEEYALLFNEIRAADTIMDLLIVKRKLQIFKKYIDKLHACDYGYTQYNKLMVCWNHKYKLHKITKSRG